MYTHYVYRAAAALFFEIRKQVSDYTYIVISKSYIVDRHKNDSASAGQIVYPYGARGHRVKHTLGGVVHPVSRNIVGGFIHIVGHDVRLCKAYAEAIAFRLADIIKRAFFKLGRRAFL